MRTTSPNVGNHYRSGGSYGICDECGMKFRRSELRLRWDKALVCSQDWEPRHPQDFVRGRADKIVPPGPLRPEATDTFRSTLVTQDDL